MMNEVMMAGAKKGREVDGEKKRMRETRRRGRTGFRRTMRDFFWEVVEGVRKVKCGSPAFELERAKDQ